MLLNDDYEWEHVVKHLAHEKVDSANKWKRINSKDTQLKEYLANNKYIKNGWEIYTVSNRAIGLNIADDAYVFSKTPGWLVYTVIIFRRPKK